MMQVCMNALYVSVSSTWSSMEWMDERGTLLRYGMVRYYLWAEKGCLYVCMRARVLGWAVLGGAVLGGAVRCCAGLGGAGAVRCLCGAGFIVGV